MTDKSILNSVKKVCRVNPSDTSFDTELIMHANTGFVLLNQLGIGPEQGYAIEDNVAEWTDFLGDDERLNSAKTYVCLYSRLQFDPPTTSHHLEAMKLQLERLEFNLNVHRENLAWVDPSPTPVPDLGPVIDLDGGVP